MQLLDDGGQALDAEFSVDHAPTGLEVAIESRGGGRNSNYEPAAERILERLAKLGGILSHAEVGSALALRLPSNERAIAPEGYDFPVPLALVGDMRPLRLALGKAAIPIAQQAGSRGGNSTKRLRLWIDLDVLSVGGLERIVAFLTTGLSDRVISEATNAPRIFASSAFDFDPELWGAFGFSREGVRNSLAQALRSQDRVLVIGTQGPETPEPLQGKLVALLELGTQAIDTETLVEPAYWQKHLDENKGVPRWPYGLPMISAERFSNPLPVRRDVLSRINDDGLFMKLATNFIQLTPAETVAVLGLPREPVLDIYSTPAGSFVSRLLRSRPGPPPSTGTRILSPTSGPAATYHLTLEGSAAPHVLRNLLYGKVGWRLFKVGFSNNPPRRRAEINAYFPEEAVLSWGELMTQWHADEINAYAMEQAVFEGLARRGAIRVKGEIVLTTPAVLQAAWVEARMRAQRPTGQVEVPANLE